jgi:ParB family chromosome partitioning protein
MELVHIELGKLSISPANMRHGKKAPGISDILPSVRARGVLVPLLVRPNGAPNCFEIVAGRRRFHAAQAVVAEGGAIETLPCAVMEAGDDAAALEASLIENVARLDPDEVAQWETFVRLVKEARGVEDIAATFGLPDLAIRRVLALGNLLPRIRDLYRREKIDAATVRHLTLASKSQQKAWLALYDDPDTYVPTGHQLKAWLFGGQSIPARHALFNLDGFAGNTIADLFGDDRYFADADQFWEVQNAAIEQRRAAYLEAGWSDVVIVPPSEHFSTWEYERAQKRKGGRVYIDVRASGEVIFYEGYLSRKEAKRLAKGEGLSTGQKSVRPEVTSPMQTYIDLHRHAAVRAKLTDHPGAALRLAIAHAIGGSSLWSIKPEPQRAGNDAIAESVAASVAETAFAERRQQVLALLSFDAKVATVVRGYDGEHGVAGLFHRLLALSDEEVLSILAIVMGETLEAGSAAVEALGVHVDVEMAAVWQPDAVFFDLIRDREVLTAMMAEVAGPAVASANAKEKVKTQKAVIRDYLNGNNGRPKVEHWLPRWMRFPVAAYTERGGFRTAARWVQMHDLTER